MPEPTSPHSQKGATGNRRVDRLLRVAHEHGWEASHSMLRYSNGPDSECWTLRPEPNPGGRTLTVYPGLNHSATVYADVPGNRDWSPITQRDALSLILENPVVSTDQSGAQDG